MLRSLSFGKLILAGGVGLILAAGILLFLQIRNRGAADDVAISGQSGEQIANSSYQVNVVGQGVTVNPNSQQRLVLLSEAEPLQAQPPPQEQVVETQSEPAPVEQPTEVPVQIIEPTAIPPTAIPPTQAPVDTSTHGFVSHTVLAGDTLWSIAQAHGSTVQHMAEHDIASGDIVPGNVLNVPVGNGLNGSTTNYVPPTTANCNTGRTHTVSQGDNVFRLGLNYGVAKETIRDINGLDSFYTIYPGQVLCIP